MKAIIFNDKDNSDRSLDRLNKIRNTDQKRFWKTKLFHQLIFKKVKNLLKDQCRELELVKTFIYTGEYNAKVLNNIKKNCGAKIKEMNELIQKEDLLLQKVIRIVGHDVIRKEVIDHVTSVKTVFEQIKLSNLKAIEQQQKNARGQEDFFSYVKTNLPFTELRTTPLVTRQGFVRQKGVDAKLSTDLLQLGQSNAYDVAILLTGDADLKETIKLIRRNYGKLVFLIAYTSNILEEKITNTISDDLLNECDYFINLSDLSEQEILEISDLKQLKSLK